MDDTALKDLDTFFSQYPIKQYHKGQILIYANEDPSGVFYLVSGTVRKYDVADSGDEIVMNVFKPSVFFPIAWALNKTPNRYFFQAESPIAVRRAPSDEFVDFLKAHPKMIYALLEQVYLGLESTQRRIIHLMHGDTRIRVLFELVVEGRRSGKLQDDGSCLISIGTAELAQRAGLSRETISRELAKIIHNEDILMRQGRLLVVRDFHALEDQLGD